MIQYRNDNLFNAEVDALVNTVNCVGIMGRGLALQFKNAFPNNFRAYATACRNNRVRPGQMFVVATGVECPRYIVNFPTKRHWRNRSRLTDIEEGLDDLREVIRGQNIRSIAIPALGTSLGGLDWTEVRPRIEEALGDLKDVEVTVFEPGGKGSAPPRQLAPDLFAQHHFRPTGRPNDTPKPRRRTIRMTPPRAALLGMIRCYLDGLLDPYVTLLEVHKLLYFLQCAGQPLRLRFVKGWYGPYAENLRHLLRNMEPFFRISSEEGDAPHRPLEPFPEAMERARTLLTDDPATRSRYERVRELIAGFEEPSGLELLSTVHWVVGCEHVRNIEEITAKTHAWHRRKRRFASRQIGIALDALDQGGWIELSAHAKAKPAPWEEPTLRKEEEEDIDQGPDPHV